MALTNRMPRDRRRSDARRSRPSAPNVLPSRRGEPRASCTARRGGKSVRTRVALPELGVTLAERQLELRHRRERLPRWHPVARPRRYRGSHHSRRGRSTCDFGTGVDDVPDAVVLLLRRVRAPLRPVAWRIVSRSPQSLDRRLPSALDAVCAAGSRGRCGTANHQRRPAARLDVFDRPLI